MTNDSRRQVAIKMLEEWRVAQTCSSVLGAHGQHLDLADHFSSIARNLLEEILMLMGVDDTPAAELRRQHENPYEREPGRWYYFDETADEHGPFESEERAKSELDKYCNWLEHGNDPVDDGNYIAERIAQRDDQPPTQEPE